jgi:hypothetical protein
VVPLVLADSIVPHSPSFAFERTQRGSLYELRSSTGPATRIRWSCTLPLRGEALKLELRTQDAPSPLIIAQGTTQQALRYMLPFGISVSLSSVNLESPGIAIAMFSGAVATSRTSLVAVSRKFERSHFTE